MRSLVLLPRAESDLTDAALWYEREREGLGVAFEQDFDQVVERIRAIPRQFPEIERPVRRALLRRFPYAIFFLEEDRLVVLAVLHQHRHPDTWRGRLDRQE